MQTVDDFLEWNQKFLMPIIFGMSHLVKNFMLVFRVQITTGLLGKTWTSQEFWYWMYSTSFQKSVWTLETIFSYFHVRFPIDNFLVLVRLGWGLQKPKPIPNWRASFFFFFFWFVAMLCLVVALVGYISCICIWWICISFMCRLRLRKLQPLGWLPLVMYRKYLKRCVFFISCLRLTFFFLH